MGEAFDRAGQFLGSAEGATKREVFDKLQEQFKDAAEIRIRSIERELGSVAQGPANEQHVDTPVLAAKRRAFDNPTQENLDALIAAVRAEAVATS